MADFGIVATLGVFLLLVSSAHAQTMPTGCSYDDGVYICDYTTLSGSSLLPLQASSFNPIPQRLRMTGLPASLTSAVFHTDFGSMAASDYDTNYPASLEFLCENGGSLTVASGFLQNMDHVEEFRITNCALGTIPTGAFTGLGNVDQFILENGTVADFTGMLDGITVHRNTSVEPSYPKQRGAFVMKNIKMSSAFPSALFSAQDKIYELVLRNIDLTALDTAWFSASPPIRHLDLSHNTFPEVPSNFFSSLTSLGVIKMQGMDFDCSCSVLWFLGYAREKYITLEGDMVCSSNTTGGYAGKLAWRYWDEMCVTAANSCDGGLALLGACLTPIDLTGFSIGFIAFVLGWVVLGITIHTRRQMGDQGGKKGNPPGGRRKPPGSKKPPSTKSGASGGDGKKKSAWPGLK